MDKIVNFYKHAVKKLLTEFESLCTDWSKVELIFDDERMRYMVVRIGWFKAKYIHHCLVQIDIIGDTIMIQANNTETMLDEELIRMGIPANKIRLGFVPAEFQDNVELELAFEEPATQLELVLA